MPEALLLTCFLPTQSNDRGLASETTVGYLTPHPSFCEQAIEECCLLLMPLPDI